MFVELAASGVHDRTGVGPVVIGAGQVVVVQAFDEEAVAAVQETTGTLLVLFVPQVIWVQPFDEVAVCGVQEATGTLAVVTTLQVVVV